MFLLPLSLTGDSDLFTQLSAVTIGQKMKMSVDEVREDGSVTFKSDELSAATVLATKDNVPGEYSLYVQSGLGSIPFQFRKLIEITIVTPALTEFTWN